MLGCQCNVSAFDFRRSMCQLSNIDVLTFEDRCVDFRGSMCRLSKIDVSTFEDQCEIMFLGCPAFVCVSVRSVLPPHASRPRNIGTYIFTAILKTLLYIIIVISAENVSFKSYGRHHLLALNATNYSCATKYRYQRNPRNVDMTLLFVILTKIASFRNYNALVYLFCTHILNINMRTYITSAHVHELSGCVHADAYNLILIFASYYYVSWP